jgi:hypothetical protein
MSTLRTDTLSNAAGSKSVPVNTVVDGSAKAWVNFNGTGTVAIRASFNVTSITDNGVGDYTVNFTNAMANADYCSPCSAGNISQTYVNGSTGDTSLFEKTTTTLRINTGTQSSSSRVAQDYSLIDLAIFH